MAIHFKETEFNTAGHYNRNHSQDTSLVFHAMSQKSGDHETSSNDGWEWVTGVTMTAIRPNSAYHITVGGFASANGSNNGKGIPYIRIRRGNTNTYVGSNSNGIAGRTSENTQTNKTKYDDSLFSLILEDQPGLRTGDTVTYSLQLKCNKVGNGNYNASMGGFLGKESSGQKGAYLNVREMGAQIGESVDILGRDGR